MSKSETDAHVHLGINVLHRQNQVQVELVFFKKRPQACGIHLLPNSGAIQKYIFLPFTTCRNSSNVYENNNKLCQIAFK